MTDLKSEELWNILIMEKIKFHLEKYMNPLLKSSTIEVDVQRKKVADEMERVFYLSCQYWLSVIMDTSTPPCVF